MKITLAYSPCPNDCFIFDALVNQRIDTGEIEFVPELGDVETLNQAAFNKKYDVTKLSYHAYAWCCNDYVLLDSGSALGRNCGPLLIAKDNYTPNDIASGKLNIAIPGKYTTANFLLGIAFPLAKKKTEKVFSSIEDAVVTGEADAGLIIHENRFTFEKRGLKKIIDLGEFWERRTGFPIPLGGIAVRRDLPLHIQLKVNELVRESVRYAFQNPSQSLPYVREHAQEMDVEVMKKHIELYVNSYSENLGVEGRNAVREMFKLGAESGAIPVCDKPLFIC